MGEERWYMDDLELVVPSVIYRDSFKAMVAEYANSGSERYTDLSTELEADFEGFLRKLEQETQGLGLLPGYVPQTTFWLVRDGTEVVGTIRLRHWLTPSLRYEIGHVGYDVRPSQRGNGYATRQLELLLEKARDMGMRELLVTCDKSNPASARVIEKNGGKLEAEVPSKMTGEPVLRFWIEL